MHPEARHSPSPPQSPKYESRWKACPRSQSVRPPASASPPRRPRRRMRPTRITSANLPVPCRALFVKNLRRVSPIPPVRAQILMILQLQRHGRGALRSLWQVRPGAVCRLVPPTPTPTRTRAHPLLAHVACVPLLPLTRCSQIRQGIANNTKGTAFVVYEDVMDAKSACDKLNGFNFQNRYLVGTQRAPCLQRPTPS